MVVAGELDGATGALLRDSATIEHAGQCTALRVAVLDARHVALDAVHEALRGAAAPATATDALATDVYAGLFPGAPASDSWGEDYVRTQRPATRRRRRFTHAGRLRPCQGQSKRGHAGRPPR